MLCATTQNHFTVVLFKHTASLQAIWSKAAWSSRQVALQEMQSRVIVELTNSITTQALISVGSKAAYSGCNQSIVGSSLFTSL